MISLSGCDLFRADKPPIVNTQIAQVELPRDARVCPEIPQPPDPDDPNFSQRDVAIWAVDVTEAGEHCRRDLGTVVRVVDDFNQTAEAFANAQKEE